VSQPSAVAELDAFGDEERMEPAIMVGLAVVTNRSQS
jgi:hypothetical protein